MDNECKGCPSKYFFDLNNRLECLFSRKGLASLPDCPCKTCLVKVVCNKTCFDLVTIVNNLNNGYIDIVIGEAK